MNNNVQLTTKMPAQFMSLLDVKVLLKESIDRAISLACTWTGLEEKAKYTERYSRSWIISKS